jgi:hypothetical protein
MNQVSAQAPPTRGLVVIAVAVVVGGLLLAVAYDGGGSGGGAAVSTDSGDDATTDTTAPEVTASTAPSGGREPAQVPVYVANGSGAQGRAQAITDQLIAAGYTAALPPGNATETEISQVFFLPEYDAEAAAVAAALSLGADRAVAMPATPPFDGIPAEATVVVQLGTDLAA